MTMYWSNETTRHPASSSSDRPGIERAASQVSAFRKGAPFAEYDDWDSCVDSNSDKRDADAYCGEIKHRTEDKESRRRTADSLTWFKEDIRSLVDEATSRVEATDPTTLGYGERLYPDIQHGLGSIMKYIEGDSMDVNWAWSIAGNVQHQLRAWASDPHDVRSVVDELYDRLDRSAPRAWRSEEASRRSAADASPTSQKPGVGEESDSPTVPEEHPEEDGTLKAMIARAIRTAEAEQWREVEKGLWRFEDDQFMASVTAPWPGEEAWSWTVETLARQQIRGGQAYGRLRAMSAAEDVMSAHRTGSRTATNSEGPFVGSIRDRQKQLGFNAICRDCRWIGRHWGTVQEARFDADMHATIKHDDDDWQYRQETLSSGQLDRLSDEFRTSSVRTATTAEGMAKRMGPGYYHEVTEYGTFGIEAAPELGGWLLYSPDYSYGDGLPASSADDSYRTKAEAMTAIREMCEDPDYYGLRRIGRRTASDEDEPKRKRQPGGQAANWGAGQLTPQRIRDEMALGQGVDFGSFGVEASFVHVGGTRIDRIVTMLDRLGLSLWTDKGPYANTVWAIDPVDQMYVPVKVTKRGSYVSARIIEPLDVGQNGAAGYDEWFRRRINRGEPTMISMDESEVVDTLDFLRAMKRTASLDSAGIMDRVVAANSEFEGAEADIRAGVPFVLVRADSDSGTGWKMTVVVEEAVQVPSGGVATDYENAKIVHMDKKDGRYSPAETAERWLRSKFNYSPDVRIVYVNGAEPVPRLSRVLHAGYQSSDWRDYPTGRRHTAAVKTAMNWWDAIDDPRHVVSGWNWDDRLAGYVSEGVADFACKCGSNVTAPGQVLCSCGKFWNSYVISSTGGMRLVCREVPVRDGVLLASRQHVADGQRVVRDPEYWGLPEGTPIEKGMKPKGKPKGDSDSDSGSESETPEAETPEAPPAPQKQKVPPLTPEELEQRITEVQAKVDEAKKAGLETDIAYAVDGKRDTYNADRRREQRRLLGVAWSRHGAKVPREGKALMSGGLGGAGKGTVLRSEGLGIDKSQYLEVNADEMKELMVEMGMVPEVEGVAPMELAALIHEESSYLSTQFAYMAYAQGTNVLWDITMGSPESVQQRIDDMREAGYEDISAVFVDIPVEKSVERALSRYERGLENYRNGKGNGGRYVPPKVIRKNAPTGDQYNSRNRETFESLKDQFDNAAVYDNSVDGRDAQKVTGFGRWARALRARYARRRR